MSDFIQAVAVSDTHGNKLAMEKIVRQYSKLPYLFHLGDYSSDAKWLAQRMANTNVLSVRGNCDWSSSADVFEEVYLAGQRIVLTHGHTLGVKYNYDEVLWYAQEHDANAIFFGHTHIPLIERREGILLLNPGSAGEPRDGRPTVAVMLIGHGKIIPKIVRLIL